MIRYAYEAEPFEISGGTGWINGDWYDVDAKPPASSKSSKANRSNPSLPPSDEQRQMLQSLLADRFHLMLRRVTKEGPIYLLVRGTGKLKLEEPKDRNAPPGAWAIRGGGMNGDGLQGSNISMSLLAKDLGAWLRRPVQDRTGLKDSYDFKHEIPPEERRPDDVYFTLTDSLRAIGLRLEAGRGPISTLVIEHAEKPSPN